MGRTLQAIKTAMVFLKKYLVGIGWVPTRYHRENVTNTGRQLKKTTLEKLA